MRYMSLNLCHFFGTGCRYAIFTGVSSGNLSKCPAHFSLLCLMIADHDFSFC